MDPSTSIALSTKRKRDGTDDGTCHESDPSAPSTTKGAGEIQDVKRDSGPDAKGSRQKSARDAAAIRDYFRVIQKLDEDIGLLKLPLPESNSDDAAAAPQAKRQKAEDEDRSRVSSLEDKVTTDAYATLEDLLVDVTHAVNARLANLKSPGAEQNGHLVDKIKNLKGRAHELYLRELAYPNTEKILPIKSEDLDASQVLSGRASLMTFADIGGRKNRPLLTSLQLPDQGNIGGGRQGSTSDITEAKLPPGITLTHALSESQRFEKPSRTPTLGELFPSPRNLPPLQPPKATKSTTKSNVLTFYNPMLTIQSGYRTGTYFSQPLAMGQWLDYSNATPTPQGKTKQRERAQSLAGVKPTTLEKEMSEMDTLFRRAFSSFAPCKDNTAAVVPSGQLSRMHWQRYGRRNLQRMIISEMQGDASEALEESEEKPAAVQGPDEINEDTIKEAINTWDDSAVDPSLDEVLGTKTQEEKELDDLLQEVSDLIETLASYQRNRNLTLPTSQDRFSADPPNGDMLRNGALSHQPTEEEMLTYQMLKSQLSLIISSLPPYAVARLNSDKLEDLSVSTRVEIRTEDYKGVMEEDEQAARVRQAAAQVSAPTLPRSSSSSNHRSSSVSNSVPYGSHQYGGQFAATGRSPMPGTPQPYTPQTPVRGQPANMYQQRSTTAVPIPQPHQSQARHLPPQQQQPYRAANGYGTMAPQHVKAQTPYGHTTPYGASGIAGQPRMQPQAGYNMNQSATPSHAHASRHGYQQQPYSTSYSQQQASTPVPQPSQTQGPAGPQMQPPHHQPTRSYTPYVNGAGQMAPQRIMSPQVSGQPQPPNAYSPSPTPPQQHQQLNRGSQYGTPNPTTIPPNVRNYNNAPTSSVSPQIGQRQPSIGVTGYHTVMGPDQQKQVMEQARQQVQAHHQVQAQQQAQAHARLEAQSRVSSFGNSTPQANKIVGLDAIGLKPPVPQSPRTSTTGLNGSTVLPPAGNNNPPTTGR